MPSDLSHNLDASDPAVAVRQYGDPVLRQKARAIRKINAGVRELAARMASTMYEVDGVGLAAPQIGESRRVVVLDIGDGLMTMVNPRVVSGSGRETQIEACLSVVGLCGEVERYERVRVKAIDLDGKEMTVDAEGMLARALQHEIDHLDGILYTDRAITVQPAAAADDGDDDAGDDADEAQVAEVAADDVATPPAAPADPLMSGASLEDR